MELNIQEVKSQIESSIMELEEMNNATRLNLSSVDKTVGDDADKAEEDRDFREKMRSINQNSLKVKGLRKALVRIENDTFQDCKDCLNEIPAQRLIDRPDATRCVECESIFEIKEKRRLG